MALPRSERVRPLPETGTTPGLADLAAERTEYPGNRFAAEPWIRLLDLTSDSAGARKYRKLALNPFDAALARGAHHQRRLQQVVVAAVGARADQGLVEGDVIPGDFLGRVRVSRTERLRNHWADFRQIERFVDVVAASGPEADRGIRRCRDPLAPMPLTWVTSSGAKMPFSASASAIMFAIVLR